MTDTAKRGFAIILSIVLIWFIVSFVENFHLQIFLSAVVWFVLLIFERFISSKK